MSESITVRSGNAHSQTQATVLLYKTPSTVVCRQGGSDHRKRKRGERCKDARWREGREKKESDQLSTPQNCNPNGQTLYKFQVLKHKYREMPFLQTVHIVGGSGQFSDNIHTVHEEKYGNTCSSNISLKIHRY